MLIADLVVVTYSNFSDKSNKIVHGVFRLSIIKKLIIGQLFQLQIVDIYISEGNIGYQVPISKVT